MKTRLDETANAAEQVESLRLEVEQRQPADCRKHVGELEQVETLLAGENRLLEMVARGCSLPEILSSLCQLIEEISSGCLCGIVLVDPTGTRLEHGAAPSLPSSYNESIHGRPVNTDSGPCATAACLGKQIIAADVATDTRWRSYAWRPLAIRHGLRACWSTPIMSQAGRALGTFAIYWREPRSPTARDQNLIEQTTHLAAVAIERKRAEESLRRSEAYLAEAERLNHTGSWAYDVVRRAASYWSAERFRISGFDPAQEPPPIEKERATHTPESWSKLMETIDRAIREKADFQTDSCLVFPDGSIKHLHIVGHPVLNSVGDVVELVGTTADVTATRQAGMLLAGEKRLLEMIAKGDSLSLVLAELCRLFEELCAGSFSSILLLDPDTKQLRHGAAPSLPQKYIEAINGGVIGPSAGSCGTAAYRGEPVIASNIATDPLWADYRDVALAHGLRACWSTPILSQENNVLGTFAIYYREPRSPDSQQQAVIDQLTHLACIALERKRAEETLRRSEAYLAEAQKLSRTGSFGWNVVTGELYWSAETFCIVGYDRTVKPTLELVYERTHPQDRTLVRETLNRATRDEAGLDFEHRLLMPDGAVKHVHVLAQPVKTGNSALGFVGAVMDITEKKKSEDAVRAAKARFEGILEIAEDAIISVDSGQHIVLFNQGAEKVFGYAQAEVIGKPLDILLPQRFAHAHSGHIKEFARSSDVARTMGQRREVFGLRKDGSEFPAEASISKLDLGGELVFTVILRDVTERKQSAEALRASEHLARGQLAALTRTLDSLAQESNPDKLPKHVVVTLLNQMEAHSATIWERNGAALDLIGIIEEGRFKTRSEAGYFEGSIPVNGQAPPLWNEALQTGAHIIIEDINKEPSRIILADGRTAVWHTADLTAPFANLKVHLTAQGVRGLLISPMMLAGQLAGIIGIRFAGTRVFGREEIELTKALAHQAMLAIQLMRLSQQRRDSAVVAERNRVARDIHDTLAQGFTGIIIQLEAAKGATLQGDIAEITRHIERAGELARSSLGEARRSVRALRPRSLQHGTLCVALTDLLKRMSDGTDLRAEFQIQGEEQAMPAEWEEDLLRITQESLTNVIKHARARNFRATLSLREKEIQLQLVDDGRGFDLQAEHEGFGLIGMRERVDRMKGQFILRSKPGEGTEILVNLNNPTPLKSGNGNGRD